MIADGGDSMRYPAAEQLESSAWSSNPVCRYAERWTSSVSCLASFYRWYDRYQSGGYEALKDRPPRPKQAGTVSRMMFGAGLPTGPGRACTVAP